MKYVIEFRSGNFFQNLAAIHSGPKETAQQFDSMKEAERFMNANRWIYANGGMAVPLGASPGTLSP